MELRSVTKAVIDFAFVFFAAKALNTSLLDGVCDGELKADALLAVVDVVSGERLIVWGAVKVHQAGQGVGKTSDASVRLDLVVD